MKNALFFIMMYSSLALAMSKSIYNKKNPLLTSDESQCWLLFDARVQLRVNALKALSSTEQNIIAKKDQGDLKTAYTHWTDQFFLLALTNQQPMPAKYTGAFLTDVLLKMSQALADQSIEEPSDPVTARLFAYSKRLTPEQRQQICPTEYKNNRTKACEVLTQLAQITIEEFVKLGIVRDEPEIKQKEAQNFLEHKKLEYQLAYD